MSFQTLTQAFHKAEFSPEIVELKDILVTRIAVNQSSRIMRINITLSDPLKEEHFRLIKQDLQGHFPTLLDIEFEVDGTITKMPDDVATQTDRPKRAKKVKVHKTIPTDIRPLSQELIVDEEICVEGIVFKLDKRVFKTGRVLITFDLSGRGDEDRYNAVSVKLFAKQDDVLPLKKGETITVRGKVSYDEYAGERIIIADTIAPGRPPEVRQDNAPEKRVELHLHTTMSSMDAVSNAAAYVKRAALWGHPAIAITDHGVTQAFPEAANAARGTDIKILYGMEAYLVDDTVDTQQDPEAYKKIKYNHAILFAANQTGLKNLYTLVSSSHIDYFFRRPRLLKSVLKENREGLIVGSACEAGDLFRAIREGKSEEEIESIASFYDYFEIQPLGNNEYMLRKGLANSQEELKDFNLRIVKLGEKLNVPVVATCDVHFLDANDEIFRRIIQAGDGYDEADMQAPLYFRNTEEMLAEFEYLGEQKAYEVVVTNTRKMADSIEHLNPIPKEPHPPIVKNAEEDVEAMAMARAHEIYGSPLPQLVADRMKQELDSIIKNGFAGMYIISQKLVARSEENGFLVGSRGSVGSSLVATMTGITEVNPLAPHYYCIKCHYFDSDPSYSGSSGFDLPAKNCPNCGEDLQKDGHDIPFETFLGFDGDKEPDIDLNFSGIYQARAHAHAEEMFGKGQIFKSGTISSLAEKTAFGYVKKYFEAKNEQKRKAEINRLVAGCTGIKRTTGQHPGGLIVVPEGHSVYEFCPVQYPANKNEKGVITTHFDYASLEGCLFKLDILGHDVPTILNLLHQYTGVDPRNVPLGDKDVISFFTNAESLGLPEFGTNFVRQMLLETRPENFSDLVRISGLSHGTNVWTNNGQDLIKNKTATLKEIIPCRDDIMVYLMHKGVDKKAAFKIMESVRKGKGITIGEASQMLDAGIPEWYVDSCRKIEYLFPKAHAVAYVLMTVRIAYFKRYYPEAFYAATFSVKTFDFDYAAMCVSEQLAQTKQAELKLKMEAENKNGADSAKDKSTIALLELVLEMYKRGIAFAPLDVYQSEVTKFKPTEKGILPPLCTVPGLGESVAETIAHSRKEGSYGTIEEFKERTKVNKTILKLLRRYKVLEGIPETDQMTLFE